MANKLTLEIDAKGAEATASKVERVAHALDALKSKVGNTGQSLSSFISSFPASYRQQVLTGLGIPAGATGGGGGRVPPVIPPPLLNPAGAGGGRNISLPNLLLGAAVGLFHPLAGARILGGGGGGGAGGGGIGGIIANAIFGSGGPGSFGLNFTLLETASRLLRFEFEQLAAAVKQGSKLFQDAALAGRSPHNLFALQAAGRSIGLSSEQVSQLAYNANLFRPGRLRSVSGQLISVASGMGQAETGTRILQAQKQFEETFKTFQTFSEDLDDASKSLFYFQSNVMQLVDLFKGGLIIAVGDLAKWFNLLGFQVQVVAQILPYFVRGMEQAIATFFGGALGTIAANLTKYLPTGADLGKGIIPPGGGTSRPESSWEKMGLVIAGGVGAVDYARQTAENTKKIADALTIKQTASVLGIAGQTLLQAFNLP